MKTFKIRHKKTGEFSRGGYRATPDNTRAWSHTGKIWPSAGAVRGHLRLITYHETDAEIRHMLKDMEVLELDGGVSHVWDAADFLLKTGNPKVEGRRPKIGVIAIIFNDKGQVLMGRRVAKSGIGQWEFPGGKLEFGETLSAACVREVKEETGLDIEVQWMGEVNEWIREDRHYIGVAYSCLIVSGEPRAEEGPNGHEWVWIDANKIPTPLFYDTLHLNRFGLSLAEK